MFRRYGVAATVLLTGCMSIQSLSSGTLILKPCISAGNYTTNTLVSPYTQASIDHLVLKLYTFDGTEHDQGIQKTLLNAQLGNSITFANLKANTTYRIKAYAYSAGSALISTGDANCYTDVIIADDDRPTLAVLKVKLIDQPFNGQATASGIVVSSGGYTLPGAEQSYFINQGIVSTLAGSLGNAAYLDGTGAAARFANPCGIRLDAARNVYEADFSNGAVRKITPAGVVTTVASGLNGPRGVDIDGSGNVYVTDSQNNAIRKIAPGGSMSTFAGVIGSPGTADGTAALFNCPHDVVFDSAGNLFVTDVGNNTIRKITPAGVVSTFAGTPGVAGYQDGDGTQAMFNFMSCIAIGADNTLYVADRSNHVIRKITSGGHVSTYAGTPGTAGTADGAASVAQFNTPRGVAVDAIGNVYVADNVNHAVRVISTDGIVTTLAGSKGTLGYQDGTGAAARFAYPVGIAVDGAGIVYVGDNNGHAIRAIK